MLNVTDISGTSREEEHTLALEIIVDNLREELRLLKLSQTVIEVTPKDMVSMETYNKLLKLYNDLWDDTMAF